MAKKIQIPVIGGLRKSVIIPTDVPAGTTIAEIGSKSITLAQLAVLLNRVTSTTGGNTAPPPTAALVLGPGLSGGGVLVGAVPLRISAPIPAMLDEGAQGEDGMQGPPGRDGAAGKPGAAVYMVGDDGVDGEPGPPGAAGPAGAAGAAGLPGAAGPPGMPGEDGEPGDAGPPGLKGAVGATGAQGLPGAAVYMLSDDGLDGDTGPPGVQGPAGPTGATGAAGSGGASGSYVLADDTYSDDIQVAFETGRSNIWAGYNDFRAGVSVSAASAVIAVSILASVGTYGLWIQGPSGTSGFAAISLSANAGALGVGDAFFFQLANSATDAFIGNRSALGSFTIQTAGSNRIAINNTGNVTIPAPTATGGALAITGFAGDWIINASAPATASNSFGMIITAGTNISDKPLQVRSAVGTNFLQVYGDGGIQVGTPVGSTSLGVGTINVQGTVQAGNAKLTTVAAAASAATIILGSTTAATASTTIGGPALPALAAGYWIINVAGTSRKVPFFAT